MSFGIAGVHRVGKTTLAKRLAETLDLPFLRTDVTGTLHKAGFRTDVPMSFKDRMKAQHAILEHLNEVYRQERIFITDRTPLCLMMYTLGDVTQDSGWDQDVVEDYQNACFDLANQHFSHLFVVQPGIQVEVAEGKGNLDEAYMNKLSSLILGLSVDDRLESPVLRLPTSMTDLNERSTVLARFIQSAKVRHVESSSTAGAVVH